MEVGTNIGRIKNRPVQRNNTSGCTGVSWHSGQRKWYARICLKGKTYNLGYFDNKDAAIRARKRAEKQKFDQYLKEHKKSKIIDM